MPAIAIRLQSIRIIDFTPIPTKEDFGHPSMKPDNILVGMIITSWDDFYHPFIFRNVDDKLIS
jgi:hypothetical protein